ncbi:MAG: AAA family ATPase [Planctomycetota bacterium]|nr:AAA family ATPase [Planctomycetota bacterium]
MLSLDALHTRFSDHFSSFEPIDETVARCVRSTHGNPFAVYYIDISQDLPSTMDELNAYQDRIIASRYFDGRKSLQWSQYLYFVVAGNVDADIRILVERDRKYARKFVVNEEELVSALTPPKFQVAEGVIDASVLSTWTERLAEANLDHVIFNSDSLPQRIKRIEAEFGHKGLATPSAATNRRPTAPPFLSNIVLNTYRACPVQSSFDLGAVTLITGANGTGKTSLMEAIELLYCGTNKRDPKSKARYAITATFRDGKSESAKNGIPSSSDLRDRNLAWYGQTDIRTNTLYQSFSRCKFLDTDAAVGLADSKSDFEEDLSKLLVGPEASKTWREIERTNGELEKTLKELTSVEQQVRLEFNAVERQLAAAAAIPKESDALLTALAKTLKEAGWPEPIEGLAEQVPNLISVFAVHGPVVEEALACEWIGSPLTIQTLRQFVEKTGEVVADAEEAVNGAKAILKDVKKNEGVAQDCERKEKEIRELVTYLENEFAQKENRLGNVEKALRDVQRVLAASGTEVISVALIPEMAVPLSQFHEQNIKQREQAEAALSASQHRLSDFTKLRDQAQTLAQQLRDIASQILSEAVQPDTCPLCHAEYEQGDLNKRIYQDVNHLLESQSLTLREAVRQSETGFAKAKQLALLSEWLLQVAVRMGVDQDSDLPSVKQKLVELYNQYESLQSDVLQAKSACQSLRAMGLTLDRYNALVLSLTANDTDSSPSLNSLNDLLKQLTDERKAVFATVAEFRKQFSENLEAIAKLLGEEGLALEEYQRSISKRRERRDLVQSIVKKLDASSDAKALQEDQPLSDLHTTIKLIRKFLSDVQVAITNEQKAIAMASEASKRKDEITQQLSGLEPRIKRLRDAESVFKDILEKHSLAGAMEAALQKNKAAIEEIVRRIHSPAEFSKLQDMTTLIRKNGEVAKLQQISTGQRAAFALSLFLAQNAQLRSAPQLMLIDDPIAHVDELNCLSFLDYLREVALSGERQIVFATANEKLASLFQRKFDFLGESEFVRYDFERG